MKKRTEQLRDAEEVALPASGSDVFTTRDQLELSAAEREQLAARLVTEPAFRADVEGWVKDIISYRAAFLAVIGQSLTRVQRERLNTQVDGTEMAVRIGERVLAVHRPIVPSELRAGVLDTLERMGAEVGGRADAPPEGPPPS